MNKRRFKILKNALARGRNKRQPTSGEHETGDDSGKAPKTTVTFIIALLLIASLACSLGSALPSSTPTNAAPESSLPEATTEVANTQTAAASACANPLYPFIPGYQWIYEIRSEGETSQVGITVTAVDGNQATINALYLETGVTTEATVDCDGDAILNIPVVLLGFLFGDVDGSMNIEHVDGVFIPSYTTLTDSNWDMTWEGSYLASGTMEATMDGDQITGRLQESPLTMVWQVPKENQVLNEAIETKAGVYAQAIKVQRVLTLDFTAELEEEGQTVSLDAILTLESDLWFEPNIGLIKQQVQRASVKVYGINFPIEIDTTIELVEFRTEE